MFLVSWQWFSFSDQVSSYAQRSVGQAFEQAVYKYAVGSFVGSLSLGSSTTFL